MMFFTRISSAVRLFAAASMLLAGLAATSVSAQDDPLQVVTTFSITADWAANVGGENATVTSIVPAGGDAHSFDPSPATVADLSDADVVISIGPGFDGWVGDVLASSGTEATHIELTADMTLLPAEDDEHAHEDDGHADEDDHDGHDHGAGDPHIWGDVENAIASVEMIRDTFIEADADHAQVYEENAAAYIASLEDLDAWILEEVETIPGENRHLVTSHDTFGYYAEAYGFDIIGTALGSITTESGDPSAADIAALVESIRGADVPAIFAENVVNPDLMQAIADEAGVELAPALYSDALGEEGSDGATYIDMMTYNTNTIVDALSGE